LGFAGEGKDEDGGVDPEVPLLGEPTGGVEARHRDAPHSCDLVPASPGDALGVGDLGGVVGAVDDEVIVGEEELLVAGLAEAAHRVPVVVVGGEGV
jgi:hypothetical protein